MLEIEQIDDYLRVTGYADGTDWLFLPTRPPDRGYGVAGPEHVWTCNASGHFDLFHAIERRHSASIELGEVSGVGPRIPLTVSRDGRRIFVLRGVSPTESDLAIIDVAAGEVSAVHRRLPGSMSRAPLERPDGRLLLAQRHASLILLDPETGAQEETQLPGGAATVGFLGGSPDGRYWVRFDQASLPTRDESSGMIGRLFSKPDGERRYGLTVQLWEAFPLQLIRRMVVAWVTAKELPNETDLARMRTRPPALPSRRALWDVVAAATAAAGGPLDTAPPRSAYPPAVSTDEAAWQVIERNLDALARRWVRIAGWQPDGSAFWVDINGFLSCVGVDATISPRLYTERRGLEGGTIRPTAAYYKEFEPIAGRKARVVYADGEALFDGAPSRTAHRPLAIPVDRDVWRPRAGPDDPEARARVVAYRRVAELKDKRRMVIVPLAGWTEAECLRAIDALTELVREGELHRRAIGTQVTIVFELNGERIPESRFFPEAGARFPGLAPALRRLVDRFADAAESHNFLFADPEGHGALGRAVEVLGVLDHSALPTLERYGLLVDAEHEYSFARDTVPAVIAAHGWTDAVIDFVFWVLIRNYYNTLQDYGEIWRSWGLRDAVVRRDPRVLARHVASELAEIIRWKDDPGRYGTAGLDQLAKQIPQPHEPWAKAFFEQLERVAQGGDDRV